MWVSRLTLPAACAAGVLVWGLLTPLGCAQRSGAPPISDILESSEPIVESPSAGLIPKLLGNDDKDADDSERAVDPFLAANFPAHSAEEVQATGAASVRVVEHEQPVVEMASPEASPSPRPTPSAGGSQLDRLKSALSRDAKTQVSQKSLSQASEAARRRVEALMRNARVHMENGNLRQALRWAMGAEQLATRSELFYGPDEDPPADLVRILQDRLLVPPEPLPPVVSEPAVSNPAPIPGTVETPEFSIVVPEIEPRSSEPPARIRLPEIVPATQPYSTRAMQKAVIAPETLSEPEKPAGRTIAPVQRHTRSLKVDARRVNANQGAVVSVEGQLNPPPEPRLPEVPLAPPVREEIAELPPLSVVMGPPEPIPTTVPPPLPPPTAVEHSQPPPAPFLYADNDLPAPKPKRNVQWDDLDAEAPSDDWPWWIFPAMGIAGAALMAAALLKWKQS